MLDKDRIPNHIAIIMDGNGRWAKSNGVSRFAGHNAGMKAMKEIVKKAKELGVEHLTVYAFSTENWKRSEEEVSGLFKLLVRFVGSELTEIIEQEVKINVLGNIEPLPRAVKKSIEKAVSDTAHMKGMNFNIAINYGGRSEIVEAVKRIGEGISAGSLKVDDIDENLISSNLYTGIYKIPDPQLIIRSSGEQRLSNFLLWQAAYSEFVFSDELWPDFIPECFERAIEIFQNRNRRFGGRN